MFGCIGFGSVVVGGLLLLLGMMCMCCVVLVVVGLWVCYVLLGGVVVFWFGNMVLNLVVLVFMGFVFGWYWSVLCFVFGIVMVFGIGYLLNCIVCFEDCNIDDV